MISFPNERQVKRSLDALKGYGKKTLKGLEKTAKRTEKESNERAPVDQGELIGSSRVVVDQARAEVRIEYTAPHALYVHEDPTLQHRNGEDHFLTKAVDSNIRHVPEDVIKEWQK